MNTRLLLNLLSRGGLALGLLGLAGWAGLAAIERSDAAAMGEMSDTAFRVRMAAGLPDGASASWYAAVGERALRVENYDPEFAVDAFEHALRLEDRDGENWARLAYARFMAGDTPASVSTALGRSYQRMPIGQWQFRRWRLTLVEATWNELPVSVRAQAVIEGAQQPESWLGDHAPSVLAALQTSN